MMNTLYKKKKHPVQALLYGLIYFSGLFSALLLAGIVIYILFKGAAKIDWTFLSTVKSVVNGTFGILGYIINTLYIIFITLLIATPIGIGAAIYLTEYAKPGKIVKIIEFAIETLSGIPSIIFGLFGMVFFGQTCKLGFSIICGSLTLTLMILPIIVRTTQETLKTVPESYRMGALGMGAEKWYIIRTIVLPSALPGIVTAVILAIGRIVGESAALMFTAGSVYLLPKSLFGHLLSSGGSLTIGLYLEMAEGSIDNAFGMAFVLVVIVLAINLATRLVTGFLNKKNNVTCDW